MSFRNSKRGVAPNNQSPSGLNPESSKKRTVVVWPEWNEADLNSEKWDVASTKGGRGEKEKGKPAATVQHLFEDPEGRCEIPPSLKVAVWKRPSEFLQEKTPVVVDTEGLNYFDLMSSNAVVHESQIMRWITSQISSLWHENEIKQDESATAPQTPDLNNVQESMYTHSWRPWEHIYAMTNPGKAAKSGTAGPNMPFYNPSGKYIVRLYWMGCWRKLVVDDTLPFDEDDHLLLPATTLPHELWPMLLTKALLKISALDNSAGGTENEFGDFSVIPCLTGWLPEVIPLQHIWPKEKYGHMKQIWELLKTSLSEFKLPEPPLEPGQELTPEQLKEQQLLEEKAEKERLEKEGRGRESKDKKGKDKNKKDKSDKDDKQKSTLVEEAPKVPERPEIMVFAAYQGLPNDPTKMARLADLVDVSEKLKQHGLSHCYAHPVLISQTRSCPLERPPAEEKIPAWKLIRPKKQALLSAETCGEMEKKIQSVHLLSPFVGYRTEEKEIDDQCPKTPIEISMIQSMDGGGDNADICQTDAPSSTQTESVLGNKSSLSTKQASKSTLQDNKTGSAKSAKSKVESEELTTPSKNGKKSVASKTPNEAKGKSSEAKSKNDDLSARKISETTEGGGLYLDPAECGDAATVKAKTVKDFWMDFDALCICFKSLYIYHKPNTYLCNQKLSDLKTPPPQASSKVDKKATPAAVAAPPEEKSPQYLFVDNVKPTEIVVSFSALCQWNDPPSVPAPPPVAPKDDGGRGTAVPKGAKDAPVESAGTPADPQMQNMPKEPLQSGLVIAEPFSWKSLVTGQPVLRLRTTGNRAAVLSLPAGRHVLRFTMAAPLGYQIHLCSTVNFIFGDEEKIMPELTKESLRFKESAVSAIKALGICLQTFGNSEKHCPALKEFLSNHLMFGKSQCMSIHQQAEIYKQALYTMLKKVLTNDVVLQTLLQQQVPPPSQQQQQPGQAGQQQQQQQQQLQPLNCPEMSYAWRVFNFDCTTPNPLGLHHGSYSRPATAITVSERASSGGKKPQQSRKSDFQKKGGASEHQMHQMPHSNIEDAVEREKVDYWRNKEITPHEHHAATKVQKLWKAYYVRKIARCRCMQLEASSDNKTFLSIREQLLRAWSVIEMDVETNGVMFFKTMFNLCPKLMASFPFYNDEWNKIVYTDYQGVYPDHSPNSWFLLFREIFYVTEDGLCIPRLTCPIPSSTIRVVNNDTKTELPRVFFKVAPHVFKKNKTGYTFLAEAWTGNSQSIVPAGKWKMRLIGSKEGLPTPGNSHEVNTSFNVQELREYYVPDKKVIFRYTITVKTDQLITLQMSTSKPDVYFKLSIYDNGKELSSTEGKGHAIIPAFIFRKDPSSATTTEPHRPQSPVGSKSRSRSSSATSVRSGGKKKGTSDGKTSPNLPSSRTLPESSLDLGPDYKDHKYTIEAVVLRDSWPLNSVQWMFVQSLKDNEKNQSSDDPAIIKTTVEVADNPSSVSLSNKGSKTSLKSGKPTLKEKEKRPSSSKSQAVQFDETKPNWTLRIVADGDVTDAMKVRRDTEKSDEIKAMKKAWEEAEPGRAAKAKQSRLQYLAKHLVKCQNYEDISQTASTESVDVSMSNIMSSDSCTSSMYAIFGTEPEVGERFFTSEPPPPKLPTEMVPPIDLTPFFRKTREAPCLRDDAEIERELELKTIEMQEFRAHREKVEEWREKERLMRNAAKVQQLELCQQMQDGLNEARLYVNIPREAYRQKLLEVERKKMEEIAAAEAALQAELEKNAPQKGKKSPAKKKK